MNGRIQVRTARPDDVPAITRFLHEHWRANHVFVSHPELLRWQHESPDAPGQELTFVLAERQPEDAAPVLLGLLGYIPFRRFDRARDWTELSFAIWKVRDDAGTPGLGLQLLKTVQRERHPALLCAIGISEIVKPIYKALGFRVTTMSQAALFPGTGAPARVAAGVPPVAHGPIADEPGVRLLPIEDTTLPAGIAATDIDALAGLGLPRKSWDYVIHRYIRHPVYRYAIRAVVDGEGLRALLVWRRTEGGGGAILRIVDVIGNADVLGRCGPSLRQETLLAGCEYLDIVYHGIEDSVLRGAGFVLPGDHDGLVLPNYFEPFEQRNVVIDIAYRVDPAFGGRAVRLFRGDSDQDRPNSVQAFNRAATTT